MFLQVEQQKIIRKYQNYTHTIAKKAEIIVETFLILQVQNWWKRKDDGYHFFQIGSSTILS